jgi:superfamily II DNA/RNA helicase
MGFIPDIERICKLVPFTRQTLFFSATMPPEITRLTEQFLHNPVRIEVAKQSSTAATITQTLVKAGVSPEEKRATLRHIVRSAENFKNAIIFCNRKRDVQIVYRSLEKHGFSVGALHGDLDQRARMAALDAFRNDEVQLLVCSDVAARGLDIPDVSHVINYDAPHHAEDYVHRIGRTGRAGKSGCALTIVSRVDQKSVDEIEKLIGRKIEYAETGPIDVTEQPEQQVARPERGRDRSEGRGGSRRERGHRAERSERPRVVPEEQPRVPEERPRAPLRAEEQPRIPSRAEERPRREDPRGGRRRERTEERDEPVLGLGDHVPSFLLRPTFAGRSAPAKIEAED